MGSKFKKISIIVPVFNESDNVKEVIKRVLNAPMCGLQKEIVLIDDGSNDGSTEIVKRLKVKGVKKIFHKTNRGKGASVRDGFKAATGDVVIIQDADLEYNPDEIQLLVKPIVTGLADVVYGSRFVSDRPHRVLYFWHWVSNSILTFVSNALTNLNLTDMESGYKAFSMDIVKKIAPNLESDRFGFEPEVTARVARLARRRDVRIYEVGISYSGRTYSEGKKIKWYDAVYAFWYLLKYNILNE